mmetsp:Transcript_88941/g.252157  ORF Transcript_88941/g.252157 Transcript_88941/m.252157 type:complete len:291 (-) Transcript_88941:817-1689(-)
MLAIVAIGSNWPRLYVRIHPHAQRLDALPDALELVVQDREVEALRLALEPQAALAELVDVDLVRPVAVEEIEKHTGVISADVQRLNVPPEAGIRKEVLHLLGTDQARLVLVHLPEDLLHVRHRDLPLPLLLLDNQVLVILRTRDGGLYEDTGDHVEDAEQHDGDVDEEERGGAPVGLLDGLVEVVPREAVRCSHEEAEEALPEAPEVLVEAPAGVRRGRELLLRRGLGQDDGEEVHDEGEEEQGAEERLPRRDERVGHLLELADRLQGADEPDSAEQPHEADPAEAAHPE